MSLPVDVTVQLRTFSEPLADFFLCHSWNFDENAELGVLILSLDPSQGNKSGGALVHL